MFAKEWVFSGIFGALLTRLRYDSTYLGLMKSREIEKF